MSVLAAKNAKLREGREGCVLHPPAPLKGGMLRVDVDIYSPFEGGKGDVLKNQI